MTEKVNIRPGVSVLSVLRHLNYRPWYALGEFVDNSVQSFNQNIEPLRQTHGEDFILEVDIYLNSDYPPRIVIKDNAAGISESDYERAFRPAAIPPNRTGLAEFGMGMKSAACWFAPRWSVRTTALGEPIERTVKFDIEKIVHDDIKELAVDEVAVESKYHYTVIELQEIFNLPVKKTVGKIKEHLTEIYRGFIRNGILRLKFNGEVLAYSEPRILQAAYFRDDGPEDLKNITKWRKTIEFDFGNNLSAFGFAALRETANTAKAGFSLFRRGRVIQGSGDEGYRPEYIFGKSNSFRYQRLFGELHLEGFEVSHTKDGFRWDENEQPFLELLREHLDSKELPLLKQADGYRVRANKNQLKSSASRAVENTVNVLDSNLQEIVTEVVDAGLVDTPTDVSPTNFSLAKKSFNFEFRDEKWEINVELVDDPAENDWLFICDSTRNSPRTIDIRLSMVHPFMIRFAQTDAEDVEALLRVACSLALAEVLARESGAKKAGTIRRNVNEILREVLSRS